MGNGKILNGLLNVPNLLVIAEVAVLSDDELEFKGILILIKITMDINTLGQTRLGGKNFYTFISKNQILISFISVSLRHKCWRTKTPQLAPRHTMQSRIGGYSRRRLC